jgi:hypothetical protein
LKNEKSLNFVCILTLRTIVQPGLPNPNFRNQEFFVKNQELIRRFSIENQGESQEPFSKKIRKLSGDIFKKSGGLSEGFLNQAKQEKIRQFSLGKAKLSLLKTLVTCLYQASNGNNCLTSEIKKTEG